MRQLPGLLPSKRHDAASSVHIALCDSPSAGGWSHSHICLCQSSARRLSKAGAAPGKHLLSTSQPHNYSSRWIDGLLAKDSLENVTEDVEACIEHRWMWTWSRDWCWSQDGSVHGIVRTSAGTAWSQLQAGSVAPVEHLHTSPYVVGLITCWINRRTRQCYTCVQHLYVLPAIHHRSRSWHQCQAHACGMHDSHAPHNTHVIHVVSECRSVLT